MCALTRNFEMSGVNIKHFPRILGNIPLPQYRSRLQNESPINILRFSKIEEKYSFTYRRNMNAPLQSLSTL